jgi:hypothetical protein
MCIPGIDPVTLAIALGSAAASSVGSMVSANEAAANNKRIARARNQELSNTLNSNNKLSQEATDILQQRLDKAAPEEQQTQTQDTQQKLQQDFTKAVDTTPTIDPGISGSAPEVVKTEMAKRLSDSLGKARTSAQNLGKLNAYGQNVFNNNLATQQAGRDISVPVGFARSNMDLLPALQDLAGMSADRPSSGLGSLLQGLGAAGGSIAGSGYFAPATGHGVSGSPTPLRR